MLKKVCKSIFLLSLTLLVLCAAAGPALAASDERGSLSVTMKTDEGKPIPGGKVTIYYVAYPDLKGADWYFHPTEGFQNCKNLDLTNLEAEGLVEKLESHIQNQKNLPKITKTIDQKGFVKFDTYFDGTKGLKQGLYLVMQTEAAHGYDPIHSFLVTIPYQDQLHVDAKPKFSPPDKDCGKPDKPDKPDHPNRPNPPGGGKPPLIQTGQLNWPVPVMAGAGVILFTVGWVLVFGKRNRHGA